ncbi:MAG: CvpA family protein [Oscillospiraceae bacterium]|jgi:hypothetical protein|nr:CvpA family protein [Oscillospiraceae bacterium]
MKSKTGRILTNLGATVLAGLIYFYIKLPAINLQDPALYHFAIFLAAVFCALSIVRLGLHRAKTGFELWQSVKKQCLIPVIVCGALFAVYIFGQVISAPIFRAGAYRDILSVRDGDFAGEVAEASFSNIPMLDQASAVRLGDRKMGELSDLVSQFEVADAYTQINRQGVPLRVTYLKYGDFFKWWNNRSQGLPAYITVDMVTQEANVVRLSDLGLGGIKYSPSELFGRKLERHLRFNYPTFIFDTATLEIDDSGTPFWVCPRIVKTIGLFGGTDIRGAVLVNAITGECVWHDNPPTWVDRVYNAELIMRQYDYHGTYVNGFFNSLIGQRDVTVTTSGYNYLAMDDDVYMYTGVTSVGGDESNIGFLLSNQRTKETTYYAAAGAIENSAQLSAQGMVQDLGYTATFPLLLNVAGEPTYFMSLKDASQLVKQYAMVNVRQYQIVAIGTTVTECEAGYLRLLSSQGIAGERSLPETEVTGVVEELRTAVIEGNTRVYIRLRGDDFYYAVSVADSEIAAVLSEGDRVTLQTAAEEGELRSAFNVIKG